MGFQVIVNGLQSWNGVHSFEELTSTATKIIYLRFANTNISSRNRDISPFISLSPSLFFFFFFKGVNSHPYPFAFLRILSYEGYPRNLISGFRELNVVSYSCERITMDPFHRAPETFSFLSIESSFVCKLY